MEELKSFRGLFPLELGEIYIDLINLDEAMVVRKCVIAEPIDKLMSNPVKDNSWDETRENLAKRIKNESILSIGVYLSETKEVIGEILIFDFNSRNKSAEMGYFFLKEYRRKGYAKLVIKSLLDKYFIKLKMNRIRVQTGEFNTASIALINSLGFVKEAVLREHHELDGKFYDDYLYSILRSEYA